MKARVDRLRSAADLQLVLQDTMELLRDSQSVDSVSSRSGLWRGRTLANIFAPLDIHAVERNTSKCHQPELRH